jgi:3-deoxy-D-manno-octulosonic acid kinase
VLEHERARIEAALFEQDCCEPLQGSGRGVVFRFPLGRGSGIVRRCRRGGFLGPVLKDRYLLHNRPLREWRVHTFLFERGLSVPEPLGVFWTRSGVWFSGSIATREVPGEELHTLAERDFETLRPLIEKTGTLIRQMHDLGVYHADLQVGNVIVDERRGEVYLIDFDKAHMGGVSSRDRARNLLRFRRSCMKRGLPDWLFDHVCRGYGIGSFPRWLDWVYRAKGAASDRITRE